MFLVMGVCLGLSAFALLGGAALAYFRQRRTLESRTAVTGTVVELASVQGRRGYIYCPVVEFTISSGQTIQFTSDFGSRPAGHRVGQTVNVRYDPADPQKAEIESTLSTWFAPGILIFMGVIACCLSVVFVAVYVFAQPAISP
jgi:hypothetical protein